MLYGEIKFLLQVQVVYIMEEGVVQEAEEEAGEEVAVQEYQQIQ